MASQSRLRRRGYRAGLRDRKIAAARCACTGAARSGNRPGARYRRPESGPQGRAHSYRIDHSARRRLHVLTIGVSDYGDKAKDLRLKFAHRDAQDLASALANTQEGGLYAEVKLMSLHDSTADKPGIFEALSMMDRNMGGGAGQDLAVVMFSGHGTMIDGQFYLVPYGADNSTPARLKVSAIAATEFQSEIT